MLKIHTAKKDHKCSLCGKKIPAGDRYWREHNEGTGNTATYYKEHTNCELYTGQKDV